LVFYCFATTYAQGVKKSSMQVQGNRHVDEQKLLEARQQLADTEHSVKSALKRNQELQARCDELSRQCEVERKAKYVLFLVTSSFT
jgi:uncharacterized protein involved in exopolysaccharide biosynthesis